MPTSKRRINVTPPKKLYLLVQQLAEEEGVSVSTKALELMNQAIEMEEVEDMFFSQLADALHKKNASTIAHDDFWSEAL